MANKELNSTQNGIKRKKEDPKNIKIRNELSHIKMESILSIMVLTVDDMNEFLSKSFTEVNVLALEKRNLVVDHTLINLAYRGPNLVCFHVMYLFSSLEERNKFLKEKEDYILEKESFLETTPLTNLPIQYENIKGIEAKLLTIPLKNQYLKNIRILWTHGNSIQKIYVQLFVNEEKSLNLALKMVERIDKLLSIKI